MFFETLFNFSFDLIYSTWHSKHDPKLCNNKGANPVKVEKLKRARWLNYNDTNYGVLARRKLRHFDPTIQRRISLSEH